MFIIWNNPHQYFSKVLVRLIIIKNLLQNFSPRPRKARKSLDKKWSTPGDLQLGDTLILPETPVSGQSVKKSCLIASNDHLLVWLMSYCVLFQSKSLIGDQSIVFSPPSIIKETLHEEKISLNDAFTLPNTPQCEAIKVGQVPGYLCCLLLSFSLLDVKQSELI